jgi:hypothetical protein
MCMMNVERSCGHIETVGISMMTITEIIKKKTRESEKKCKVCAHKNYDYTLENPCSEVVLRAAQKCSLAIMGIGIQ